MSRSCINSKALKTLCFEIDFLCEICLENQQTVNFSFFNGSKKFKKILERQVVLH